jgi:hypothetical protein
MKSLILTACILACTVGSANAQCTYRMNDVGRPHGYLSGPCNGAAQSYSGAYPSHANPSSATWYRRDGSLSPNDPSLRTVRQGNTARVYDGNVDSKFTRSDTVTGRPRTTRGAASSPEQSTVQMERPCTTDEAALSRRHPMFGDPL